MSLDYMFIPSAIPLGELHSIEDLQQGEALSDQEWLKAGEEFFPDFTFEAGAGSHKSEDVTCELSPTEAGLIVHMRGGGDIVGAMGTAATVAARRQVVVLDLQTSELFVADSSKTSGYQAWYGSARKQLPGTDPV